VFHRTPGAWSASRVRGRDGGRGLVVLDTEDEQAARDAMERDPSVVAGLQQGQLYPFAVFLERSRVRPAEPGALLE
jgi:hypothetical protein